MNKYEDSYSETPKLLTAFATNLHQAVSIISTGENVYVIRGVLTRTMKVKSVNAGEYTAPPVHSIIDSVKLTTQYILF